MQLYYREKGAASNPPLIILHGLWGASDNWLEVANLLSDRFHVIIPDLPNHGKSFHHERHDYEFLADCVYEFIAGLNLSCQPYWLGHSMGGKILMHLLLKWPKIAQRAAIVDIIPKDYGQASNVRLHHELIAYIKSIRIEDIHERSIFLKRIQEDLKEEELYQLLAKNIRKNKESGLLEWKVNLKALQTHMNHLADWQNPSASICPDPILFIKGECSDYIHPTEDLPLIRQYFPKANLTEIPEASHAIHATHPQQLTSTLLKFFLENQ